METTKSVENRTYTAANGSAIKNEGEKVVSMVTRRGDWKSMKFQMCNVTRPLASVHKICEKGHSVVFNPSWDRRGSFILDHGAGDKTWLTAKDGVFALETKIAPAKYQRKPGFTRQGK